MEYIDLSGQSVTAQKQAMEDAEARLQASLNLAAGDLVRMAVFNLGSDRPHQLLVIHPSFSGGRSFLVDSIRRSRNWLPQVARRTSLLPSPNNAFQ